MVCPYEIRRFRLALKGRLLFKEVKCPLGCDEKVRQTDVRFHTSFACMNRIIPCRFAPVCGSRFPVHMQDAHERGFICAIK